jgi:type I restriction enzyme S subunit
MRARYKQTEIGLIPLDWNVVSVSNFGETKRGASSLCIQYRQSGGVRLIRINDFFQNNPVYVEPTDAIMKYAISEYDLLFAGTGASAGASYLPRKEWIGLPHSYNAPRIRISKSHSKKYLLYSLQSGYVLRQQRAWFVGNAQPFLDINAISSFSIAIPPTKSEEEAIVEVLSDADTLIESLERLVTKKRAIKQGAMQELLTGERRLPGFKEEWQNKRLGLLGTFFKGCGIKKDEARSGNLPCIRYGEIYTTHHDRIRSFTSWVSRQVASTAMRLKRGDILFAGSGETKEEIGKCVAFLDDIEAYAGGDIVVLRPTEGCSEFLGYYLNAPFVVSQKASKGQGDAIVHISSTALGAIDLNLPRVDEQQAIAAILFDLDDEIDALEAKLAKTRQIKQGMMQELLTGRIRLV